MMKKNMMIMSNKDDMKTAWDYGTGLGKSIFKSLFPLRTYSANKKCSNCGVMNVIHVPMGQKKEEYQGICKNCGCELK